MTTMNTQDHSICFNVAGTWCELEPLAEKFGVSVEEVEEVLWEKDLDWIGDDLVDRVEAFLIEELVDIYGEV